LIFIHQIRFIYLLNFQAASTSVTPLSGTFVGLFHGCHNASTGHEAGYVLRHDSGADAFADAAPTAELSSSL